MPKYHATWTETVVLGYATTTPIEADNIEDAIESIKKDTHGTWVDVVVLAQTDFYNIDLIEDNDV